MNRAKTIIGIVVLLIIIGVACIFAFRSRNITPNPPGTIGNTSGNLQNGGYFCDGGDKIFFANAYDGYSLYSMNPDESGVVKLSNAVTSNINAGGDFVFYYQSASSSSHSISNLFRINGVYRARKDGKKAFCLQRVVSPAMALFDNTVLYQLYDTEGAGKISLCRTDIDKKNEATVSDQLIDPYSIVNGTLYYAGQGSERYLYAMNLQTGTSQTVYKGDVYHPQAKGDWVYFMDIIKDYHVYRYSLSTGDIQEVTTERVDTYNVADNYIYYQTATGQNPALKRCKLDGSEEETVAAGVFQNINITSNYVYFNAFDNPTPVYHTPTNGPIQITTFNPPRG